MTEALCEHVVLPRIARFARQLFLVCGELNTPIGLQRGTLKGAQTAVGTSKLAFFVRREGNTPVPQLMSP